MVALSWRPAAAAGVVDGAQRHGPSPVRMLGRRRRGGGRRPFSWRRGGDDLAEEARGGSRVGEARGTGGGKDKEKERVKEKAIRQHGGSHRYTHVEGRVLDTEPGGRERCDPPGEHKRFPILFQEHAGELRAFCIKAERKMLQQSF